MEAGCSVESKVTVCVPGAHKNVSSYLSGEVPLTEVFIPLLPFPIGCGFGCFPGNLIPLFFSCEELKG